MAPRIAFWRPTRSPTAPFSKSRTDSKSRPARCCATMGPAPHPDSCRAWRPDPLRGNRRRRNAAQGTRPGVRHRALGHHGAQGRSASADRHRGRTRPEPGGPLHPREGPPRSARRPEGVARHAAGQDAARSGRHPGHHRRSAARHRNLRGPQAARARRHGRGRRPRPPGRKTPRQTLDPDPAASTTRASRSARRRSIWCRTASTCASTPTTTSRKATRWSTARWCRTTSCASPASRRCRITWSARCRPSTAASASTSTTSTSRSSSRRCCAR